MFSSTTFALVSSVLWQAAAGTATNIQAPAEQSVQLNATAGAIHGTLVVPSGVGKVPIVLIIAGSGPTDRDGNSPALPGKNNTYRMLADSLAAEGVASLRYDKRGIGESRAAAGTSEADLRFDMYVDDAAAWVTQLRGDARFSRVIVAGHSEGSLIGMLAAAKAKADAFVSIAGVARRASDVLRDQLRPQIGAMPALWQGSETVLTSLEAATVVDPLPPEIHAVPALASLFRPSVQPYMISWFKRAPADRAQNVAAYGKPDLPIVADVPRAIAELARLGAGR